MSSIVFVIRRSTSKSA